MEHVPLDESERSFPSSLAVTYHPHYSPFVTVAPLHDVAVESRGGKYKPETRWRVSIYYEDVIGGQFQIDADVEFGERWKRVGGDPPLTTLPKDLFERDARPLRFSTPKQLTRRTDALQRLDEQKEQTNTANS